jgi:hypothetical protein
MTQHLYSSDYVFYSGVHAKLNYRPFYFR